MRSLLYSGRIALATPSRLAAHLVNGVLLFPPSQHYVYNRGVFCVPPPEEEAFEILNDCAVCFNVCL